MCEIAIHLKTFHFFIYPNQWIILSLKHFPVYVYHLPLTHQPLYVLVLLSLSADQLPSSWPFPQPLVGDHIWRTSDHRPVYI